MASIGSSCKCFSILAILLVSSEIESHGPDLYTYPTVRNVSCPTTTFAGEESPRITKRIAPGTEEYKALTDHILWTWRTLMPVLFADIRDMELYKRELDPRRAQWQRDSKAETVPLTKQINHLGNSTATCIVWERT